MEQESLTRMALQVAVCALLKMAIEVENLLSQDRHNIHAPVKEMWVLKNWRKIELIIIFCWYFIFMEYYFDEQLHGVNINWEYKSALTFDYNVLVFLCSYHLNADYW